MTRIGVDSTDLASEQKPADVAFYYVNGLYTVKPADVQARFPGKVTLGIDVNGSAPSAAVRDWETGDKGGDLAKWVTDHNELSGKSDACIYCNRATISEVRQLTGSQVLGKDYWLWVATLDGTLYREPGTAACQVATLMGEDLTVIWDDDWHPSPSPVAHLKANILQWAARLSGDLDDLVANARRLPG